MEGEKPWEEEYPFGGVDGAPLSKTFENQLLFGLRRRRRFESRMYWGIKSTRCSLCGLLAFQLSVFH